MTTNTNQSDDGIVERLLRNYTRIPGTGERLINPDGPEAATYIATLEARLAAVEGALSPSAETKAAYIGEFGFNVPDYGNPAGFREVVVPWSTTKEIMAAIRSQALGASL